eukprot:UN31206
MIHCGITDEQYKALTSITIESTYVSLSTSILKDGLKSKKKEFESNQGGF